MGVPKSSTIGWCRAGALLLSCDNQYPFYLLSLLASMAFMMRFSSRFLLLFLVTTLVAVRNEVCGWTTVPSKNDASNRREWLQSTLTIATTAAATSAAFLQFAETPSSRIANAASTTSMSSVPSASELERLPLGHARICYLLDHWDEVTSVCGTTIMSDTERMQIIRTEGGTKCSKTPLRVQEFMGYKSIADPLYRVDKLLIRAGPLVDPDQSEAYLDAVERYREKADSTALLAYTSSWGEANPYVEKCTHQTQIQFQVCRFGVAVLLFLANRLRFLLLFALKINRNGSKELIEEYLDQTKAQVVESEKLLRSILEYLHLSTLPPLQGKL